MTLKEGVKKENTKSVVSKEYLLKCNGEITLKFAVHPVKVSCGHCPFYEDCIKFRNELKQTKSNKKEEKQ